MIPSPDTLENSKIKIDGAVMDRKQLRNFARALPDLLLDFKEIIPLDTVR